MIGKNIYPTAIFKQLQNKKYLIINITNFTKMKKEFNIKINLMININL
jgi:hypothetical protein